MNKLKIIGCLLLVIFACSSVAFAEMTSEGAESFVKKAIEYYHSQGMQKAFEEMNNPSGKFVRNGYYVFVHDLNGKCYVHGYNPKLAGKDLLNLKDPDGRYFIKERIDIARTKGAGWQEWKCVNPVTNSTEHKAIYIEKVGNFIFSSGRLFRYEKPVVVWR